MRPARSLYYIVALFGILSSANADTVAFNFLPLIAPSLSSFARKDFHVHAMLAGGEVQVDGQFSAPSVQAVPEPSPAVPLPGVDDRLRLMWGGTVLACLSWYRSCRIRLAGQDRSRMPSSIVLTSRTRTRSHSAGSISMRVREGELRA